MQKDSRGLLYSGTDQEGIAIYEEALAWNFDYRPNGLAKVDALLASYPNFLMAWVLKGYSIASEGRFGALSSIPLTFIENRTISIASTPRERKHVLALAAYAQGDIKKSVEIWADILNEWPLDLLAFRQSTGNLFWMGERQRLVDTAAKIAPHWTENTPGYGYFIGAFSFALEEVGEYSLAEKYARRAVEINPSDMWAVHSMAHVLEMNARTDEGIAWIEARQNDLPTHNAFVGHIWWHLGLFYLEQGHVNKVLSLFDEYIYPEASSFYLSVQNGASLLKRLEFVGVDVGNRWDRLYQGVKDSVGDYLYLFTELHTAMILNRSGNAFQLSQLHASLSDWSKTRYTNETSIAQELISGISAYEAKEYDIAAKIMHPQRYSLSVLGGSHAQQDILIQYLINAQHKNSNVNAVTGLMKERVSRRTQWDQKPERFMKMWQQIDAMKDGMSDDIFRQLLRKVQ
ncbi:tetratricopeptide repeat protein [Enterovibrio sp. ZSDZ42]|uniref:Tetratricopeptide repeat protein 38 n=1 Tax=Enterovibrio gelatinilyticus TaxID=2899819 RepID=A0ABT5QYE3_9GAMM|nr:tetratricopeptide repeat protein [Enterovibrio sp. ZSDZ42]MDD1793037.1 tetratricopeptide repeat protein [Enterovibrio sp. ZSDZ42]